MEEKKSLKKKIVATATAASLLVGGAFVSPSNVPDNPQDRISPPAIIELATPVFVDDDDDGDSIAIPEEEKKRKGMKQRILIALPIVLVMWVAGIILSALAMASLNAILGTVAGFLITAILLLGTYVAVAKVLFPSLTLKQILNWKALLAVFVCAAAVSLLAKGLLFR